MAFRGFPTAQLLQILLLILFSTFVSLSESSSDTNRIYSPCEDAMVQRSDGFTFGIAFAGRTSFFFNNSVQLSPCDRRLSLSSSNSQVSVFRPKVDEISLLTINTSNFFPVLALAPFSSSSYFVLTLSKRLRWWFLFECYCWLRSVKCCWFEFNMLRYCCFFRAIMHSLYLLHFRAKTIKRMNLALDRVSG